MAAGKPAEQLAIPVRLKAHGALWNRSSVGRRLKHLCGPFHRWKHIPSPASARRRTNVAGADLPPAVHKLPPAKEKEQFQNPFEGTWSLQNREVHQKKK